MHEQYSNPSRTATTATMRRRAQEAKQQEDQDSRTPMSLTRLPALLTSQSEMSWLKAVAS